jgi:exopolysaccharide biosynthesis polyprenyl glycosylphosphotransferase
MRNTVRATHRERRVGSSPSPWRERTAQWRARLRSSTALLLFCDATVLVGYLLARPALWLAALALWALTVLNYHARGAYRPRLHLSLLDDAPTYVGRSAIATALVAVAVGWQSGSDVVDDFVVMAAIGLIGHLAARLVAYRVIKWVRQTARVSYRTLVVGGGTVSQKIAETIASHPDYGLSVIGYVDDVPSPCDGGPPGWVYRGGVEDLPAMITRLHAHALLIGFGHLPDIHAVRALRDDVTDPPTVFVVPRLFEYGGRWAMQDHIGAIPIIRVNRTRLCGPRWRLKRALDVVTSGVMLIALAPVMAAVALAVRIEGGPGVIFRQQRVGRNGELFDVLKFRSMRPVAPGESDVTWSIAGDRRVGPVGRFIRRTSLDELPQLVNVLRGDMTVVGPRPERPHFVATFSEQVPQYPYRHRVPVGLTGLAQVNGLRGDTSIEDRARYDNYYIENWSLWLDVKVMLRTLRQLARPDGS